jgi:hypothetical protein
MPVLQPQRTVLRRPHSNWVAPVRHVRPRPRLIPIPPPRAAGVPESVEWFGKSIVYFTMFYCSMNWIYYRGLRKDLETFKKEQEEKKNKK